MNDQESSMIYEFSERFAIRINAILLCIHALFLLGFSLNKVYIMAAINVLSVTFYLIAIRLARKNQGLYLKLVYLEILIHLVFATLCMGWDYGFQLYALALLPMIFYANYLAKKSIGANYYPVFISILIIIIFLSLKLISRNFPPVYGGFSPVTEMCTYIFNTVATSSFIIYFMTLFMKITIRSENLIRMTAEIDSLTGINNRSKMLAFFHNESEVIFDQNHDVLVAMIDIDDFKSVNDTYGHQAGDYILQQVALALKTLEDDNIQICRWGGEEFLLFGIGENIFNDTKIKLEQLIKTISHKSFYFKGTEIPVTITAGLALHKDESSIDELIQEADENLYAGKRIGKNQMICS